MKTCEQNAPTEIERFDWVIERIQTRVAFGWLSERSGEKNLYPENFLEINWYFALTSYCNTVGQSNNAFSILGFFGGKTKRPCLDLFIHWLIKQITNTYRNHFSRKHENHSIKDRKDTEQYPHHNRKTEPSISLRINSRLIGEMAKREEQRVVPTSLKLSKEEILSRKIHRAPAPTEKKRSWMKE